jgi:hypothetical protein
LAGLNHHAEARGQLRRGLRAAVIVAASSLAMIATSCGSSQTPPAPVPPAPAPSPPRHGSPEPPGWLGLNYNSSANVGKLDEFAKRGIVFDRGGGLELDVGATPQDTPQFAHDLRVSIRAGMIPDIELGPAAGPIGCAGNPDGSTRCLPRDPYVRRYVDAFIRTVSGVLRAYPHSRFLFEPMNEPWNWASPPITPSGRMAAAEYAAVLAQLLPAAKAEGIPLSDIYVPATGTLLDGTSWISDLYQAQPCLKPGSGSCGPIAGWNIHPYGLPFSSADGIGSVPAMREMMRSGQNNIIVSEIGFCATDVAGGRDCNQNLSDVVGSSGQAAVWLTDTLDRALAMHQAGWLKALLVWNRAGDAWAMQNPDGSLTAQGTALELFARRHGLARRPHSASGGPRS